MYGSKRNKSSSRIIQIEVCSNWKSDIFEPHTAPMFQIGKTVISEEILAEKFVCDLSACKGACCVEGEAGAPLEDRETAILHELKEEISPFLGAEGRKAIDKQGAYVKGNDGEWETPLVNNRECAYTVFSKEGIAQCGIEKAYKAGAIDWRKPISCHLYPVRVREYSSIIGVNYHRWQICNPACSLGESLKVPVYRFVKEALIRKFGETWYRELEEVAGQLTKQ